MKLKYGRTYIDLPLERLGDYEILSGVQGLLYVRGSGTVIVAACCEDNMGAKESSEIIMNYEANEERREVMKSNFIPEAYSGFLLCELSREYRLILVSDYEDEEELIKCGIKLCQTMEEAIGELDFPDLEKVYILPNSCAVLPKIKIKKLAKN